MKSTVQLMARNALKQLVGIQERVSYTTTTSVSYDPTTETETTATDTQQVLAVFGNYTRYEVNISHGQIEKNDRPLLIIPSEFKGISPTFGDIVTRANGQIWEVCEGGVGLDPAEALYVLQVRQKTNG